MNLLVHFEIYGHSWCFESSQMALAYGSCNFENFQNITRAHKSRNALAFIRLPIQIGFIFSYIDKNVYKVLIFFDRNVEYLAEMRKFE